MMGPWAVLVFLILTHASNAARILGVFPFPGKSQMMFHSVFVKELASRGHELVVITPFPEKTEIPHVKYIALERYQHGSADPPTFAMRDMHNYGQIKQLWDLGSMLCEGDLQESTVQTLIHSTNESFDLIIMEAFFNDCFLGFAHKFKAPVIQICTFGAAEWMGDWVGNPNPYAYIPDTFYPFSDKMKFYERLQNTVLGIFQQIGRRYYYLPKQNRIIKKYFDYTNDIPEIEVLEQATVMFFMNGHFSVSHPRPLVPNMIQVGGLHVKTPNKLPQDLQKYLDEAKDGAIYFSMGTNLRSSAFPEGKRKAFLEVFSKLKQRILWKWEAESMPDQPSNVNLRKWLPQSDILAHPNVKLFITHGGLLSTQETIERGVPVVGIPIYGDQRRNMARVQLAGFGVVLDFHNISTQSVHWALTEILKNPSYYEKAQKTSNLYKDQPLKPMEQAVFWTEYVIRHKGALHMRSAALNLAWYQYFLLDVIAVLGFLFVIIVLFLTWIITNILRMIFRRRKSKQTKIKSDKNKKQN